MARSEDKFLVRESQDTTVAGEVWGIKTGETVYGIAGADGNAERERQAAEEARKAAEAARNEAEVSRAGAESARAQSETARVSAETARAQAQARNNADQALNNEQMKKLSPVILADGQYDRATLKPTIEGEPNRVYFVPMVAPAAYELFGLTKAEVQAGNSYVEWMWVGGRWEQMGQSELKVKPISTDSIDSVFAGEHPTGEDVLNLTGLDYTHGKVSALLDGKADASHTHEIANVNGLQGALAGKANASHTHAAGDIASGTLPIARGGTGASDALTAMQRLFESAEIGEQAPSDNEVVLSSWADGIGQDMRPVRRKWSTVWEYMRSKASEVFAAKSHRHAAGDIESLVEVLYDSGEWTVWRIGTACFAQVDYINIGGGSWDSATCPYSVPGWLRPGASHMAPCVTANGGSWTGSIVVGTSGNIDCKNYGNSGSGDKRAGCVFWVAGH